MNKNKLRFFKAHFGVRWTAFRHNRKHPDKVMPLEEKIITQNFLPGTVLAHNCLGELYQVMFDVTTDLKPCSTIALVNPPEFKYQTIDQIVQQILSYRSYLLSPGRIIVNVNLMHLIYDRLCVSQPSVAKIFESMLSSAGLIVTSILLPNRRVSLGYGQLFLICDQYD